MSSITEMWTKDKNAFTSKSLAQILHFAGDGKLKDDNVTSKEFRELIEQIPSSLLRQFADNCLTEKFEDSGFALQDIINQVGSRLGFVVESGLYRGKQNDIGYDGIWASNEGHCLVVEVKTTDAYRINLDVISEYRRKLIEQQRISKDNSSILIVVGRQDTGDLEAQIRGSRHAWDIRLLSTDSLMKLLTLKETLNDTKTIQQINELLKPREYTRIDELLELIFVTSKDLQLVEPEDEEIEGRPSEKKRRKSSKERTIPVNFHEACMAKIQKKLGIGFIKQSRISFMSKDKTTRLICAISKPHIRGGHENFWFAFHPYQNDFLKIGQKAYVAYGCGSSDKLFLIPYNDFKLLVKNFWTTENEDRMYWHIFIYARDKKFFMAQPKIGKGSMVDITKYKI